METIEYIKLWLTYNIYLHYLSIKHSKVGVVYLPFSINKANKSILRQSRFRGRKNKDLFIQDYIKNYIDKNTKRFNYVFVFMANQIIFLQRSKHLTWYTNFLFPSCKAYQELLTKVNPYGHIGHLAPSELEFISQKTCFSLDYNGKGCKYLLSEIINIAIDDALSYAKPKAYASYNQRNQREINSYEARKFFENDEFKLMCNLISFDHDSCLERIRKKITHYDLEQSQNAVFIPYIL